MPDRTSAVRRRLLVHPIATFFLVDQLERAGYVEHVPDPTDARARLIRIAERGAKAISLAAVVVAEVEAEWSAQLGRQRMNQLRHHITSLREITDPHQ